MSKLLTLGVISQANFDPITINYINRMTTKPSIEHQKLINNFVLTTKKNV